MSRTRHFIVAAGTFSVALGIGFVMQNGDALAARFSETPTISAAQTEMVQTAMSEPAPGSASYIVRQHIAAGIANYPMPVQVASAPDAVTAIPEIAQDEPVQIALTVADDIDQPALDMTGLIAPVIEATPVSLVVTPESAPAQAPAPVMDAAFEAEPTPPPAQAPIEAAPDCAASLIANAAPAAMVELILSAPCFPDAQVTIHHQGMMFSVVTDDAGQANVTVPALTESAVFIADLGNGAGAVAVTTVPDLASYDRAVLQWQGTTGPEIHALEFGAGYADEGHVWSGAARNADVALAGTGGFLVHLGDGLGLNPTQAEVYTYPSGDSQQAGNVAFSVETPVTAANCGTRIAAQTIQVSPGAEPFSFDMTMDVPGCDAVGEYLVLKNMLLDLTLAAK